VRASRSWILPLLFLAAPALAGVTSDHDDEVDFSKYKTFAWKAGTEAPNPITEKRIHRAVEAELTAKGLTLAADGAPDVYVYSHTSASMSSSIDFAVFGYGGYSNWDGWSYWGPVPTSVHSSDVYHGMLVVDLVDAGKNKLVWRAVANEKLFELDMDKIAKKVNGAIKKMFRDYPPKPAKKP